MPRVKRGTKRRQKRKKILKLAKGFYGAKGRLHRIAKLAVEQELRVSHEMFGSRRRPSPPATTSWPD